MKKIFGFLLLLITLNVNAATYYVSTTGSDSNAGTIGSPWLTWGYAWNRLVAGDILYIRAGTYTTMQGLGGGNYNGVRIAYKNGTSGSHITVSVYPGDSRPILDCSALSTIAGYHRGVLMDNCSYWDFNGLIIKNVREYTSSPTTYTGSAWEMQTCSNINITYCDVTYCMNGFSLSGLFTNVNYINCDAYENWDIYQSGDLCNGFNGNISATSTVTYTGCRAWKNCDDGFDFMAGGGYITLKNCWAFNNKPWHGGDENGNGDGFKLGFSDKTPETGVQRTVYNCISAYNGLMGFDESMDATTSQNMSLYNCVSYNNADYYSFRFNASAGTGVATLRNNISIGSANLYAGRARNVEDHNTWDSGLGVTANTADFVSVDMAQLSGARQASGALPVITAFHLAAGSDLIGKGVTIAGNTLDGEGKAWAGSPALGPYEYAAPSGGDETAPIVSTTIVTAVSSTTATSGGTVTDDGGATVTDRGICWGTSVDPIKTGNHAHSGTGVGAFSANITGLTKNTTYHVRAWATNSVGTSYGSDIQFKTVNYLIVVW
jgi:hypothetical protein